jgi:hypothetical protein
MKNKTKLKKFLPYAVSVCMLALAVSCNDDGGSQPPQGEQANEGTYEATLTTLNTGVGGNAMLGTGTVLITVQGDAVDAQLLVNGVPADTAHAQFIYEGGECPTITDDANSDTFIDPVEGIAKYGSILIPLDGDLNSQDAGASTIPNADLTGSYEYSQTGSLASMLADLTSPDVNTDDSIVKLPEGSQNLNLEGRTVVIHGVPAETVLPDTVAPIQEGPNTATLPIACGVLTRTPTDTGGTSGGSTGSTIGGTGGSTIGGTNGSTIGGTGGSTIGGTGGTVGSTIGGTGGSTIGGTGGSTIGGTGGSTIGGTIGGSGGEM